MAVFPLWRLIWHWRALTWGWKIGLPFIVLIGTGAMAESIYRGPDGKANGWVELGVLACAIALAWMLEKWISGPWFRALGAWAKRYAEWVDEQDRKQRQENIEAFKTVGKLLGLFKKSHGGRPRLSTPVPETLRGPHAKSP
jgi:hypothetical protein